MSSGRRQIGEHLASAPRARSILLALVSAGDRLRAAYDEALSPFEIELDPCRMLEELRRAGPGGLDGVEFHDALRAAGVDPGDEARLENEGWLERDQHGNRKITGPGRQLLAEVAPVLEELDDRMVEHLGAAEVNELSRLLEKLFD